MSSSCGTHGRRRLATPRSRTAPAWSPHSPSPTSRSARVATARSTSAALGPRTAPRTSATRRPSAARPRRRSRPRGGGGKNAAMQLSSLKIIVTGGAQGMGAHFARRLVEAGAQVAVGAVKEDGLAALAQSVTGPGGLHTRKLDGSNEADIGAFVDWAAEAMGGLNSLINNAGILRDGLLVKKDRTTGQVRSEEHTSEL